MERDAHIYAYVMGELENDIKDEALWIKAYAIVEGWEQKIKPKYMQYRVEYIKDRCKEIDIDFSKISKNELDNYLKNNFVPDWMLSLCEWADIHGIPQFGLQLKSGYMCMDNFSYDIGGLPRNIDKLKNLKILNLNIIGLCGVAKTTLLNIEDLSKYNLEDLFDKSLKYNEWQNNQNPISYIPSELGKLTNLTEFIFGGFYLKISVPKEIGNLINLTKLDLCGNIIEELPKEIGNLINLRQLNLAGNNLKEFPKEIENLINLSELNLASFRTGELPKNIGKLTSLTKLDFSNNSNLKELPKEIGDLVNLTELNLSGNHHLEKLPKEIRNLVNLTKLDLSSNWNLKELPKEIGDLVNLTELNIFNCKIKKLPKELKNLKRLNIKR